MLFNYHILDNVRLLLTSFLFIDLALILIVFITQRSQYGLFVTLIVGSSNGMFCRAGGFFMDLAR